MTLDLAGRLRLKAAILKVNQLLKDRALQWHSAPGSITSTIIETLIRVENTFI
jgi:hypothetical protein